MRLFKFIDAEKAYYPTSLLCRILKVSRSGYYGWKDRSPSKRDRENAALTKKIREIHNRSRRIYGYPRVHAELRALGVRCSRKRVARLIDERSGPSRLHPRSQETHHSPGRARRPCPGPRRSQLRCRSSE